MAIGQEHNLSYSPTATLRTPNSGVLISSKIIATGSALPVRSVSNEELSQHLETSDEWIRDRVGIQSRNISSPSETSVSLAALATRNALKSAALTPNDIDLIVFGTVTADQPLPSAAALLARELGVEDVVAFDLQAACSGFLFSLVTAHSLLESLQFRRALVVGAETLSRIIDWTDRNTAVLFGDGAGVCLLELPENAGRSCILASHIRTMAQGAGLIQRPAGLFPQRNLPFASPDPENGSPYVEMNGREVFRLGIQLMTESIERVLRDADLTIADISLFIPHQSNNRMIEAVAKKIGLGPETRVATNIERIGNTSAASIPIVLDEEARAGNIAPGDKVLLTAVGSGMTYGSVLLEW